MKKTTIVAIVALLVAVVGAAVAVAAYLRKRSECALCGDLDDFDELEGCDDDDECCCCDCGDEDAKAAEEKPADQPATEADAE